MVLYAPPVCPCPVLGAARWAASGPRLDLPASSFSSWRSTSWALPMVRHRRYPRRYRRSWDLGPRSSPTPSRAQSHSTSTSPRVASQTAPRFRRHYSARTYATGRPMPFAMTVAPVPSPCGARTAPTAPIAALESPFFFFSFRRRRRRRRRHRRQHHGCRCPRCRRPRRPRPCRQHSLPGQHSLAGTSSVGAAGGTLPHGTMHRILSRTATRQRSHHPTARHQGGWVALPCPGRPVSSLHQEFEPRSCHRLAPCRPSRGACASPSLWRGRGTSH